MGNYVSTIKKQIKRNPVIKRYKTEQTLEKYVYSVLFPAELIEECNRNQEAKKQVIHAWEAAHPEKATDLGQRINLCISKAGLPNSEQSKLDMKYWFYAFGYTPNEYITYGFHSKSFDERRRFISDRESVCLGHHLNDIFELRLFMDKSQTYDRFRKYYKRDCITVEKDSDYSCFCDFVSANPVFVRKDVRESCGRSIELVDMNQTGMTCEAIFKELRKTPKNILEERIEQANTFALLNPSSVNTVRCFTLKTRYGVEIPWCFMKIGRNGSFVDNGGAGGLLVGIDPKRGIFNTAGRDEYGFCFEKHPDTGVVFQGFKLPEWEKMINICKEMAELEPSVPWIGWDMTYTDQGWIVVEGNSLSEVIGPQSTNQKGIRDAFDNYLKGVDLFIKKENVYTGKRL